MKFLLTIILSVALWTPMTHASVADHDGSRENLIRGFV